MPQHRENSADSESEANFKRRKLRKGTRSCWDCKRRKLRCLFEHGSSTDSGCVGCRRRGTKCVSQEFPEEVSAPVEKTRLMHNRVVRVEAQLDELLRKVGDEKTASSPETCSTNATQNIPTQGILTPLSTASESSLRQTQLQFNDIVHFPVPEISVAHKLEASLNDPDQCKYECLSRVLHRGLPSREDTEKIWQAHDRVSIFFYEMLYFLRISSDHSSPGPHQTLLEIPEPDVHPVLIARHMLYLATFLQHLPPEVFDEIKGLAEPPRVTMRRLADIAISLVTTNDELLGSIEGLECIMIEAKYQANSGNLRRSWISSRRAMVIAQLMGFHRNGSHVSCKKLDPRTKVDPEYVWMRLVLCDRHNCLLLGLPQASLDDSMVSEANLARDSPMGRLERTHCAISSRILQRNESRTRDFALTQRLDVDLQKAARILPSKWWLPPNLASSANDPKALLCETRRVIDQVFHYNLLNLLHLPYMLCSSTEYTYSKIMCANASREMLSRFIMFRTFNPVTSSFRIMDFLALMAGLTLLLGHLAGHRSGEPAGNVLAHQCLGDRAMIEHALETMEEISRLNTDSLTAQSADLLRRLLAIEAEVADGHPHVAQSVTVQEHETEAPPDEENVVRVTIPYIGIIKIARKGGVSKEAPLPKSQSSGMSRCVNATGSLPSCLAAYNENSEIMGPTNGDYGYVGEVHTQQLGGKETLDALPDAAPQFAPQSGTDDMLQQYQYPDLAAGIEDWAFQGVDMAFFDSLMRGSGDGELGWANES